MQKREDYIAVQHEGRLRVALKTVVLGDFDKNVKCRLIGLCSLMACVAPKDYKI
jgi:hypothetical protein